LLVTDGNKHGAFLFAKKRCSTKMHSESRWFNC
jgi:hypothetical protein